MDYKVIINPELGGTELGNKYNNSYDKDYNLNFSKLLSEELNRNNIKNILVRNDDKKLTIDERTNIINTINNNSNKPIIITIGLGNSLIDIIYGLGNKNTFPKILNDNFEKNNFVVNKYYQQRDSVNTNLDYEKIIRNFPGNESIIIRLGNRGKDKYLDDTSKLVKSIVDSIKEYIGSDNKYIVKKGDTLYGISKKYNVTIDSIKKSNNLKNNNLSINQILLIPYSKIIEYKVIKGDTLYSIATKYKTSVKDIMSLNNLKNSLINVNQIIKINSNS